MIDVTISKGPEGMGWLEFIASVVSSVSWPIAIVVIAFAFRKQIASLLNKIRRLSWGDTSVELATQLDKVETASKAISEIDGGAPTPLPDDRFQRLLEISPSAAILDSWASVDRRLRQIGTFRQMDVRRLPTIRAIIDDLLRSGDISSSIHNMIRDLQKIRNTAAHEHEVSPTDAYRFYDLVETVSKALSKVPS
ncbi:hypothetical protein [uncultured Sphingopyxis sp.]|nr:hypothetical protein [uncultured Sphingopyxis sp.]